MLLMGGMGSGSYYRWDSKTTIEDGLTLNLGKLVRDRLVISGQHVSHSLVWRRVSDGEQTASIGYEANLIDPSAAWMRLHYRHNDKPLDYRIKLTTTRPHYGGLRWWFVCPANGSRVAKLHSPPGGDIFASRKAYGLVYQSQRETPMFRHLSVAQNIRVKLGGSAATCDPFPDRPKGMHWKTYWKLWRKADRATNRSFAETARHFGWSDIGTIDF